MPTPAPHDFILPACYYPAAKPYSSFTTLLHRFGRYERERMRSLIDLHNSIAAAEAGSPTSANFSFLDKDGRPPPGKDPAGMSTPSLQRNRSMDALGKQLMQAAAGELNDQRVALTPKQEIKMELARIKAAVEKLSKESNAAANFSGKQNVYPVTTNAAQQPSSQGKDSRKGRPSSPPIPPLQNPNSLTAAEKQKFMFVGQLMQRLDQRKG
ncbi:hypothetical protein DFJ77DRAFT_443870 [Powellomyces hirtus]|nr:hypothetical protein DFJ77DRAFT_443870 [Powellomyces hirtus]